jgi:hypothetical protein
MNIITKQSICFSVLHLLIMLSCLAISFSLGMERFDVGQLEPKIIEKATNIVANLLMAPAKYLWTSWASKNLPNIVEWALLLTNSLLWGTVIAFIYQKLKRAT